MAGYFNITPGLLSTTGAAFQSSAAAPALGSQHPFNTNSFLGAINDDPARGTLTVGVPGAEDEFLTVSTLTDALVDPFMSTVERVVSEAQAIKEALAEWDVELPRPLPATAQQWRLHTLNGRDERYASKGCLFKHGTGKHLSFAGFSRYAKSMGIGWSGRDASCYMSVSSGTRRDGADEIRTGYYEMIFRGEGLQVLAAKLELEGASLTELALALTNLVYFSGQYERDQLLDPVQLSTWDNGTQKSTEHELVLTDGKWHYPDERIEKIAPDVSYDFSLAHEEQIDARTIPVWLKLGADWISVGIFRRVDSPDNLMPLVSALLPLWETAKELAQANPDDDDYLVKSMQ